MRILLTGGTGFFGRALLRNWLDNHSLADDCVMVLSRNPEKFLSCFPEFAGHRQISFLKGDILDRETLPWTIEFTHVLHSATDSTFGDRLTPTQQYDQIVVGTRNILELAVVTGAFRFLLISSGAIYGSQPTNLYGIPEDWQGGPPLTDPKTAYGQGKRAAEHLCALFGKQHGLETVVARCFAFVGRDLPLDVHYAIGNFIRDALNANAITVSGDGLPLRTYLDQTDLAHWLFTLLKQGKAGQAYNVGSDEVISIGNLAHLVRDILAPGKAVNILGKPNKSLGSGHYVPDIRKAKQELNLYVRIPLAEAIRQCADATHKRADA